jgi:hypothetical protein
MDTRSLQNDHDWGNQTHWPAEVTRQQMKIAAKFELSHIDRIWRDLERASAAKLETTEQLVDWAEKKLARRETAEIAATPAAMDPVAQHEVGKKNFGKPSDIRARAKSTMGEALAALESEIGHGKTAVTAGELAASRELHTARKVPAPSPATNRRKPKRA